MLNWMPKYRQYATRAPQSLTSAYLRPMTIWAVGFICVMVSLACDVACAADSFRDLQSAYRCEIVRRLEQIHATGDPKIERDRFIAVGVARRPEIYVQCIFHNANRMAYCEAVSGFYLTKPGQPRKFRAANETVAALAALGFDTNDKAGNFKIDRSVGTPPDFNALADLILRALHDGYGVRTTTKLKFDAPFAPGKPVNCMAVS